MHAIGRHAFLPRLDLLVSGQRPLASSPGPLVAVSGCQMPRINHTPLFLNQIHHDAAKRRRLSTALTT